MTDVLHFHTADGGEIEIVGGRVTLTEGLETAAYESLFGGNERDAGIEATRHLEWWGNKIETVEARKLRSRTQSLLRSLPIIPASLLRIEDAAKQDLAWMIPGLATAIDVEVTMPGLNRIAFSIDFTINGEVINVQIEQPWHHAS